MQERNIASVKSVINLMLYKLDLAVSKFYLHSSSHMQSFPPVYGPRLLLGLLHNPALHWGLPAICDKLLSSDIPSAERQLCRSPSSGGCLGG